MQYYLLFSILIFSVSCAKENSSSGQANSAQQMCGQFANNYDTMFLIAQNGMSYALQPTSPMVDEVVWSLVPGQSGCVQYSQPIASEHGWYGINGMTNIIYVDTVTPI